MKPFVDSGFLLTLLLDTDESEAAWRTARGLEGPLLLTSFQVFITENRIHREIGSDDASSVKKAACAAALQSFRWYLEQQVFRAVRADFEIAIELASQFQHRIQKPLPAMLLLWPALAVTIEASHFLSLDPRTRPLARSAGLKLLPETL